MEVYMCDCLLAAAQREGASQLLGEFIPTPKNALVNDLYPRMNFEPRGNNANSYIRSLTNPPERRCEFIRDDPANKCAMEDAST